MRQAKRKTSAGSAGRIANRACRRVRPESLEAKVLKPRSLSEKSLSQDL
jgi:hypothetical protein